MAYTNQSVSSMADLITKINSFAVANGWNSDQLDTPNGKMAISRTSGAIKLYISFRWDTSTVQYLGIYNALAFDGVGTDPGNHTDDSGNGKVSGSNAVLATGRSIYITNNAIQFWGFESDYYIHIVVEVATGQYAHFGFGYIDKIGDWTGGEYCYGFKQVTGVGSNVAIQDATTILLDGIVNGTDLEDYCATLRAEGLPDEGGSSKWAVVMGNQGSGALGTDRGTNARIHFTGGFRGGPVARIFGRFSADSEKGLIPMYPLTLFYWNRTSGDAYGPMGAVPDIRGVNIQHYVGGQEVTIGSDTWVLFPSYKKAETETIINTSAWQGIAYKKVTT